MEFRGNEEINGNDDLEPASERLTRRPVSRWRLWLILISPVLLLMVGLAAFYLQGLYGGRVTKLDQLQHRNHVIFQKVDPGSRNYLRVAEDLLLEGVTSENNFAVSIVELTALRNSQGRNQGLSTEVYDEFSSRFSFNRSSPMLLVEPMPMKQRLQEFEWRDETGRVVVPANDDIARLYAGDLTQVMSSIDRQWLQKMMEIQGPVLDHLVRSVQQRTRYGYPFANQPVLECQTAQISHQVNQFAYWLSCRSQFRQLQGDWQGAWDDNRAVFLLAQRVAEGPFVWEGLISHGIQNHAKRCLTGLLSDPALDGDRLNQIEAALPLLVTLPDRAGQWDWTQRAMVSQMLDQLIIQGEADRMIQLSIDPPKYPPIFPGWIDNEGVLDELNGIIDQQIADIRSGSRLSWASRKRQLVGLRDQLGPDVPWWRSPIATSSGSAMGLIGDVQDLFVVPTDESRQTIQRLLQLMIAARRYEWETGKLPENLRLLVGHVDAETLVDPYTQRAWLWESEEDVLRIWAASYGVSRTFDGTPESARLLIRPLPKAEDQVERSLEQALWRRSGNDPVDQ